MTKECTNRLVLVTALLFACVGCGKAGTGADVSRSEYEYGAPPESALSKESALRAMDYERRILHEQQTLPATHWAGSYSRGDGFVNDYIHLAPDAGFSFKTYDCTGIHGRTMGVVTESNGVIQLHPQPQAGKEADRHDAEKYMSIRWDSRQYLVGVDGVGEFCKLAGNGQLRSMRLSALFFTKDGGVTSAVYGIPQVSPTLEQMILSHSASGTISEVVAAYTNAPPLRDATIVRIDRGAQHGLTRLATLYGRQDQVVYSGFVQEVGATTSVMRIDHERTVPRPRVGMNVSTIVWHDEAER